VAVFSMRNRHIGCLFLLGRTLKRRQPSQRHKTMKTETTTSLSRLVLRLFAYRHKDWTGLMNYWDTTATNGFYMPIEQRCAKCGAYQHRRLSARKLGKIKCEWHTGQHPKSPENTTTQAPADATPNPIE